MATERHDVTKVLGRLADLEAGFETVDPVELTSEERARGHVSDAKALVPTKAEAADLDAVEAELARGNAPPAPR